nr:hypothetical protein [uncultured Campylobacter sp.]
MHFYTNDKNSQIKFKFTKRFGFGNSAKFYGVRTKTSTPFSVNLAC